MRWDIFCAVGSCINLVVWIGISRLLAQRIRSLEADVLLLKEELHIATRSLE